MKTHSLKPQTYNLSVTHPLQSYEWGQFRQQTGTKVIRGADYQLTIHPIPHTPYTIGYLPKGNMPTEKLFEELHRIGEENNCIFIQLEPNITIEDKKKFGIRNSKLEIRPATHPLFTKYTFVLDLTKSEEELLSDMHPKTRYNIRVAQKHGVQIIEDNSDEAFEAYWKLMLETTKRQHFFAHTRDYHWKMFSSLRPNYPSLTKGVRGISTSNPLLGRGGPQAGVGISFNPNHLQAHLFLAKYPKPQTSNSEPHTLAAWILFTFKDTLYYPYGASSTEFRNVMASNLMMWEAIRFGKKLGLKKFDMWGSLGENPNPNDPWYGFHRLKQGYNPQLVEFIGSFDLVIKPTLYKLFVLADKLRWLLLKVKI